MVREEVDRHLTRRSSYGGRRDQGSVGERILGRKGIDIADQPSGSTAVAVGSSRPHDLYTLAEPPVNAALDRKVALLLQMDAVARALDPRVKQVIASLGSEDVVVLIATPSGWTVGDVRPLTRLNVGADFHLHAGLVT